MRAASVGNDTGVKTGIEFGAGTIAASGVNSDGVAAAAAWASSDGTRAAGVRVAAATSSGVNMGADRGVFGGAAKGRAA